MQFSCSESFYKLVKNDNPANDLGRFIRCDRWQIYSMADLFDARIDDRRSASHFQNASRASRGVPRPCSALRARLDLTVCALYVGNELVVTASEGEEVLVEVEQGTLHLFTRLPSAAVSTAQFPPNAGRTAAAGLVRGGRQSAAGLTRARRVQVDLRVRRFSLRELPLAHTGSPRPLAAAAAKEAPASTRPAGRGRLPTVEEAEKLYGGMCVCALRKRALRRRAWLYGWGCGTRGCDRRERRRRSRLPTPLPHPRPPEPPPPPPSGRYLDGG